MIGVQEILLFSEAFLRIKQIEIICPSGQVTLFLARIVLQMGIGLEVVLG